MTLRRPNDLYHCLIALIIFALTGGDVTLKIDVLNPRNDCFAQSRQPLFFGTSPPAPIVRASTGYNNWSGAIFDEPVQVRATADPIES